MKEQKYIVVIGNRGGGKVAALEDMIKKKKAKAIELALTHPELHAARVKLAEAIQEMEKEVARIRERWG